MDTIVDALVDSTTLEHYFTHGWFEEQGRRHQVMHGCELIVDKPLVVRQPVLLMYCTITITEEGSVNFEEPECRRSWLYSNLILVPTTPGDSTKQKTYLIGGWPNVVLNSNLFSPSELPQNEAAWR